MDIPEGAIPADQFEAAPDAIVPEGAIPADQFESQEHTYGTLGEQLKAGAEGVGRGLLGPIAPFLEKTAGVNPEAIRGRQEVNPWTAGIGESAGLIGGALTGTGEAAVLEAIGKGATEAAGLGKAVNTISKIGSSAVKNAAELAAYQTQDEITKAILQDPSAGAQSAIANIGLSAALGGIGGGLIAGTISPLWSATIGPKIESGLKAVTSRLGGIEGEETPNIANALESKIGLNIPDEIKAVLDDKPGAREAHSMLSQDDSSIAGRAYQKKLQDLDGQMGATTADALGKTSEDVLNVPEKNNYEAGQTLGNSLHDELKPVIDNVSDRYDATTNAFKSKINSPDIIRTIGDQLSQKSIQEGWAKAFDEDNSKLIQKILDKLPEQATIDDLKNSITNLYRPFDAPDYKAAMEARKILSRGLEASISEHMGPEQLAGYNQLRSEYSVLSNHLNDLDTHLHLGKWNGPKTFLSALKEKANSKGEALLSNMTNKNNAAFLDLMQAHPNTLNALSNHYKDSLIRAATKNTMPGEFIKTGKLLKDINEMSPQQKALIASPEQHAKIEAINQLKEGLKDPSHNFSNTARTIRKHMAGAVSPISLIAMLMGHGEAGILSYLGSLGLNEVRPGLKLAMLKFMGSSKPINAPGFAAAAEYFAAAQKGAKTLSLATNNVFKPGAKVLVSSQLPTHEEIKALDKLVASNDPKTENRLTAVAETSNVGHYAPEHQTALTQSSLQALQYLKSVKPGLSKSGPLDIPTKPLPEQQARYNRALEIAQQPATVLQHVKDGTIQLTDLQDLNGMYPQVYAQLTQKLTAEINNAVANDIPIPYKTRMGISLFLGQPMDSSMQPMSIMAAQSVFLPKNPPPQPGPKMGKKGTTNLGKSNKTYQTTTQAAESDRSNRD